jgi:hypothetical protein
MRTIYITLIVALLTACSDSSGPGNNAQITVYSTMDGASVRQSAAKSADPAVADDRVDSLRIRSVRILISRIKLKSSSGADRDVKTGPFVLISDSTLAEYKITSGEVPLGEYDAVKFEFHRFSGSELDFFRDDPVFGDFATADRWTAIIDGVYFDDGEEFEFEYKRPLTANLTINFRRPLEIETAGENGIMLQTDPAEIFMEDGWPLDPTEHNNEITIEKNIKDAIKARKK